MIRKDEILERLVRIEILLTNHLKHHETLNMCIFFPVIAGIILLLIKVYFF